MTDHAFIVVASIVSVLLAIGALARALWHTWHIELRRHHGAPHGPRPEES